MKNGEYKATADFCAMGYCSMIDIPKGADVSITDGDHDHTMLVKYGKGVIETDRTDVIKQLEAKHHVSEACPQ
ncbi:MAG: hypothetical protein GY833_21725 [Aestuariibacter sp.]|nr:hypothetical protein [Aestuariibacter sp.]